LGPAEHSAVAVDQESGRQVFHLMSDAGRSVAIDEEPQPAGTFLANLANGVRITLVDTHGHNGQPAPTELLGQLRDGRELAETPRARRSPKRDERRLAAHLIEPARRAREVAHLNRRELLRRTNRLKTVFSEQDLQL